MSTIRLRSEELEWREVDGEILALDVRRSEYVSVEGSGAQLWQALAQGTTREQLVELLCSRYEVEAPRAAADVEAFLADLSERGLLCD